MLFNTLSFAIFLPLVFILYWFVARQNLKKQNLLLLISSYVFYGFWDWRFLFLLAFSTFLDFFTGIKIHEAQTKNRKRFWLVLSLVINLGFLAYFKYFNFFTESFTALMAGFGWQVDVFLVTVILPVGISFYTFHGVSYIFDIYNGKISPTYNFTNYSVFVSFFPLLVAGPIERATHLLPQVERPRTFNASDAAEGLRQMLWGLFKKVVIADNCAELANNIFNNSDQHSGLTLVAGALAFTIQIYGDFSGYSDIALGTARLFGIELIRNFAYPYFSRDIAEFWRRWHISLSSWFRDYLYIPLGGNKGSALKKVRNVLIIFIVSGFWHGANWTFIAWGALNALYIIPSVLFKTNRAHLNTIADGRLLPSWKELGQVLLTFSLSAFAWIFFRARDLHHAFSYIGSLFKGLFSSSSYAASTRFISTHVSLFFTLILFLFIGVEWLGRAQPYPLQNAKLRLQPTVRWACYLLLALTVLIVAGKKEQFIYFQF